MGKMTLLLGGARSGKSALAEKLAAKISSRVTYIATAAPGDSEMARRIKEHRQRRPDTWETLEAPLNLGAILAERTLETPAVLLDCVTFLVSNILLDAAEEGAEAEEERALKAVEREIEELLRVVKGSSADWIVVSNEVGAGVVPSYPLGRYFRDALGWTNQRFAEQADEVYYLIAGKALPLHTLTVEGDDLQE